MLTIFIIGMALAESACVVGLVFFTAHKDELFKLGVLGMAQFIPIYARSVLSGGGES